jgi:GNAT superfamily N-acetyltransferase
MEARLLRPDERQAWKLLWQGYLTFYDSSASDDVTALTWERFHDPAEPMFAYGAFIEGWLACISLLILHRSAWTASPFCYLQDLFVSVWARRRGMARAPIERAHEEAERLGAGQIYWLTLVANSEAQALYDRVAARAGCIAFCRVLSAMTSVSARSRAGDAEAPVNHMGDRP